MRLVVLFSLVLVLFSVASFANDRYVFQSREKRQQFERITSDMRCIVCQNKSLATSTSGFADDMQNEVYRLVQAGRTDKQIVDYMTARYGYFVAFSPPFFWKTYLLWLVSILAMIFFVVFGKSIYKKYYSQSR